ncbi:type II toxin-antitoxin system RelE/ParE family toxin [Algoriphagus sp. A40]|uniref:type II toxin-antitoxin system RelE/ParE family toxin n=1 Tax=Algoriphagus sp. A40 TaxID=1945863 RepID=UPI00098712BF|nr:type II toxin-antitoxin system RelE/ParE family toxin [Algoriphagus sp. A40]OOG78297.1 plasmid stabilization protein [Algoriphagus sp. A40]
MAQRAVVWTKTADIQFAGVLEYWFKRNRSTTYSKKLVRLVASITHQIAKTPEIFEATEFKDTRVAPLENFSIFYKILDTQIIITAFWDNRQDPGKLLKILQKSP